MADFISGFWNMYVMVLVTLSILFCVFVLVSNMTKREKGPVELHGHVWDETLAEYNNPLPRWWMYLFWITIFFAVAYLAIYPGFGNSNAHRGQLAQYEADVAEGFILDGYPRTLEQADAYVAAGLADTRYDALVDEYEPGWTEAMLAPLLGAVRDELTPIVAAAADSGIVVDTSVCGGVLPVDQQEAFGRFVAAHMGYDFDAGRLDTSAHPFTTGFAPTDVRITWRADDGDRRAARRG